MALEVKFILLEPGYVELLARGTALELASNIFLVISNDPVMRLENTTNRTFDIPHLLCYDTSSANTFSPLGNQKFASLFDGFVDVVPLISTVW